MSKVITSIGLADESSEIEVRDKFRLRAKSPQEIVNALLQIDEDDLEDVVRMLARHVYGDDVIIVWQPPSIDHDITTSSVLPVDSRARIRALAELMGFLCFDRAPLQFDVEDSE